MTDSSADIHGAIEDVLAREIRPALSAHAGTIELVSVDDTRVNLRFLRSCGSCYFRRACAANLVEPVMHEHFGNRYEYRIRSG
jgi:Fe-S cluster biogenesis protein NfuA